jgi:hypothetical protein
MERGVMQHVGRSAHRYGSWGVLPVEDTADQAGEADVDFDIAAPCSSRAQEAESDDRDEKKYTFVGTHSVLPPSWGHFSNNC